jgi:GTP cyclohydrolase II
MEHSLDDLLCADVVALEAAADATFGTVRPCGSARVPIDGCETARMMTFRSEDDGTEYLVIQIGDPSLVSDPLVRLHSSCLTGDLLGSLRCDCGQQLRSSVALMSQEGCGLLIYLPQEGRGIGLSNKIRAYCLQDDGLDTIDANHALGWESDVRSYRIAADILKMLSSERIRLLSNNPLKVASLAAHGIEVVARVAHLVPVTTFNSRYLATKAQRCGHFLTAD